LALLAQAHWYANDLGRDRWDFAVEIRSLRRAGLSLSDLRWLVCKGYVEHAREITVAGAAQRDFQCHGGLMFARRTAFVLTESGMAAIESAPRETRAEPPHRASADPFVAGIISPMLPTPSGEFPLRPTWDRDRHELRVDGQLVKIFKLPSPNQEMVLAAFDEEGWPARIDDPLPPSTDLEPKRRLHDTIKSLNRNQKARLVRFMGDGTGQGIQWALISPDSQAPAENGSAPAE
jgi:hypothetical protein